ncbi:phosphate ABC transporter substrate-binding protein [Companilactobacillus sp.]|jgi:phosphate transport system substrate-binding protein|uniref:phosphate ABC transporter substrate-binding protein n=1 Tax=Companilactobacillus sp. TaxID=2767905 RepID=UPI0025BF9B57|nr:phosphate ABC transporter substrate-binding protein [Companilactobacillus sp.]MCH4009592.1 phosphate ABC transporter substrate-binding protein [Companilactobacillus sp.]MCH4052732.1 phosphate ABC transporter substrate-binding protein [Companilactobacillus sp.]MCH4077534.1 phosphate ABC transporter substrate-binding protein [Companilactobacillus sp.]MCH4126110.1 phosphate ABC transporter substrate-binding protein [Companilactobacillus sp.]MCI1311818.1 phosphate ABC transporter substrate-bind
MKKRNIFSTLLMLGAVGAVLTGCGSNNASSTNTNGSSSASEHAGKVTAVGSTALQPLVEKAAGQFQNDNKKISITVQGGGSGTGLSQVQDGAVQIGDSDIFAESKQGIDASKLEDHKVAVVGMAPVVNKDAGVENVSMAQLKDIFTGKITNWKEVGGKDEKITVVNRAEGSGTRATFEDAVLKGDKAVKSQEQDSNGTVQKIVSSTPGAISYLAFSYLNDSVKPLSIDKVKPTDENVESNKWKIWSYEHMYTKGKAKTATADFLKYMDSKDVQDNLVKKMGYISIHNMKVQKDSKGNVTNK